MEGSTRAALHSTHFCFLCLFLEEHQVSEDFLCPEGGGVRGHKGDVSLSAVVTLFDCHAQGLEDEEEEEGGEVQHSKYSI